MASSVLLSATDRFRHAMPFGAELQADGRVRFRVWAPAVDHLQLRVEATGEQLAMQAGQGGMYELVTNAVPAGADYRFVLPDGTAVPDPVSRFQPMDVNGPSRVIDPLAYTWRTSDWEGRPWSETVLYELHVGTFTPEGTFRSAMSQLPYLAELGVTAIEIMSVGDFPGRWNWGYDSVLLYAPDSSYGTPDDLKRLVDAAHQCGLMVILDVVYNHFGPEGNYIPRYFPEVSTDKYMTPWGKALNYDAEQSEWVREFIIQNALYWIEEFRMDGLRLDAVHAIMDASSTHVLDELARRVRSVAEDRQVHLILESDDTMWTRLVRDASLNPLLSTAQWNHDWKQLATLGLAAGRSAEEDLRDTALLGSALIDGFTSQPPKPLPGAEAMQVPDHLPPTGFVSFLQTHDLVGNRISGERMTRFASVQIVRALASIYLLAPQIPMLFMGEEWGASTPFPFFCDFHGDLAEAVRRGRLEQFATPEQRRDVAYVGSLPDPLAESTFASAKLRWDEVSEPEHASLLGFYRGALAVRRRMVQPLLSGFPENVGMYEIVRPRALEVSWRLRTHVLRLQANLSEEQTQFPARRDHAFWLEGTCAGGSLLGAWTVRWSLSNR